MKAMKKIFILSLVMVMCGVIINSQAFARRGMGNGQGCQALNTDSASGQTPAFARGTCAALNINEGEKVRITGNIAEIAYYGQGIKIDSNSEILTVYGLGPVWYWNQLEASYPVVGDQITVNGSKVTFSDGSEKIIALSITTAEDEVALRDGDTGFPLWRGQGFRGNGSNFPCQALPAPETTE